MATERRRRQSSNTPKSKRTTSKELAAVGPMTVHNVPDHLLELILLHLHSSACLLRAAATCKRWRRLVAETWFLARFRSLHATPCIAGNYHAVDPDWIEAEHGQPLQITGNPVFVPSSSATVDRRHFSLDFLPDSDTGWEIADSRGSLLLVFKRRATTSTWASGARTRSHFSLPDLVICEPLTRRFQGILRPADVTTYCLGVFLLDGYHNADGTGSRIGTSNFRIVAIVNAYNALVEPGRSTPVACVFTSGSDDNDGWRVLPRTSKPNSVVTIPDPDEIDSISLVGRANGSIYWVITGEDRTMLVFNEDTAEFSRFLFPAGSFSWGPYVDRRSFRVIGGDDDGALRLIRVIDNVLKVFVRLHGSEEWMLEKLLRISEATRGLPRHEEGRYIHFHLEALIIAANDKFVLMTPQGKTWPFSVDLETMKVEREHERNNYPGAAYPCELPWPPVFNACVNEHGSSSRRRR
ncbi:hypothetical protein PR202_ga16139 [Eleusine coracana subsp. coracana]|uniref:F-box domain-containing protein n=1 Tax=Eleusine coracana subsp. coracana TaxID=191504 RepID=A0AAV5CLR9_ELECO|nr:hypothetical protein QOZ80_6AG0532270 [Eleusine coracana subsp. coracana]GJM99074.1 hypothetical protein PR202_ga16139 [Eleusine coracana subsp. coracana]